VRELEAHKSMAASAAAEATSAFGLAPTHAASSAGASIADTLFATQVRLLRLLSFRKRQLTLS
jgi:hypothetical protein